VEHRPQILTGKGWFITAALLVLSALFLRIAEIGKQELWLDEALSFYTTLGPLDFHRMLISEYTPPLYELLLRGWVHLVGRTEVQLRLLSAMFGTLFVAVIMWAGTELFDRRVGLWTGVFAAIAPIHIYYSQETRSYALLLLLLTLTMVLLWRALRTGTAAAWVWATAAATAALYTHYFAVFALLPMTFMILLQSRPRARQGWVRLAAAAFVCVAAYAPIIYWQLIATDHSRSELTWVRMMWEQLPPALAIPKTMEVFWLGSQAGLTNLLHKVYPNVTFPPALRLFGLFCLIGMGIWIAIPWKDAALGISYFRERTIWIWSVLLVPLAALWLISFRQPLYGVGRYDLIAFPGFALLVGLALAKLQSALHGRRLLAAGLIIAILAPIGLKLDRYYRAPPSVPEHRYSARLTAEALSSEVGNGDVAVLTGLRGLPVMYYLMQRGYSWKEGTCAQSLSGRRFGCRLFPLEIEQTPGTLTPSRIRLERDPGSVRHDVDSLLDGMGQPGGRLWVAFQLAEYSDGDLYVATMDELFVSDLLRRGFRFAPANVPRAMNLFVFQR
jgi:4-amino-4-deoxy-L-arabinose transferase-like glycosyltransferase